MAKKTVRPLVRAEGNNAAYEAVFDGSDKKLLVCGPTGSGKSVLLNAYVATLDNGSRENAMLSSSAEMCVALFVGDNDALLIKLGEVPVLVLEDIQNCAQYEQGDLALNMLVTAREKQGLRTILSTRLTEEELVERLPEFDISGMELVSIAPLGSESLPGFVVACAMFYGGESAPTLAKDAVEKVIELSGGELKEVENMVHYLVAGAGFDNGTTLTADLVAECFA